MILQKTIDINIERQITSTYCGQSTMQAIGTYYGTYKNQNELFNIARLVEKDFKSIERSAGLKCDTEGTGHVGMIVMANSYGFHGFIKNKATFQDLKYFIDNNIPTLVNWQTQHSPIGEYGHYSIIRGYCIENINDQEKIIINILDPFKPTENSKYDMEYNKFHDLWYDFAGKRKHDKWMAAFYPKDMNIKPPSKGLIVKS